VFFGIVPMAVAVGAIASVPMRRYGPVDGAPTFDAAQRRRVLAAIATSGGIAVLVVALRSANTIVLVGGSVAGVAIALPALRLLLPTGVFTAKTGQPAVIACRFLATATFMGVDGFVPLAADRIHGASPTIQGFVIIGAALTWTGGQALVAHRPHTRPNQAVRLGFALLALATVLVTPVLWAGWPLWATFMSWAIGGLGMGILFNPTTTSAMSYATPGREGDVSSQVQLTDALGFSLMGGIGGATVALADRSSFDLRAALAFNFALAIACAVVGIFAGRGVRPAGRSG
jgi:hypothetical protein